MNKAHISNIHALNSDTHALFLSILILNSHMPYIDAISGALITLSLSILILNSQCEEGARDGIDIWYMGITWAHDH